MRAVIEPFPALSPVPTLPVVAALQSIVPDGVLVRGRTVLCSGDAAVSLALLAVAAATQAGAWLAIVGVPNLGLLAASEQGVALQRTVLVTPADNQREWASTVATVVDGFDVVMLEISRNITVSDARKLQTRVQARRAVLVVVDTARRPAAQSVFAPDVVLHTTTQQWHGLDGGAGYAQSRDIRVQVSGRRVPKPTQHCMHHVG